MTTPALNTPIAITTDAYQDAGILPDDGQELTPEQLAKGLRRLRDLINTWQTQGIKLWLNQDTTVPLTAGTATYTFAPGGTVDMTKPLRVLEGYYLYSATNVRRPLTLLSWNEYLKLGQAGTLSSNQGPVTQYFVDKRQTQLAVTFWLCPNTDEASLGAVHLLLQTQVTNPISLTETMNFPDEWRLALRWGLAADLCTGQPEAIVNRCEGKAEMYRNMLEGWDVEDASTFLQPDPRAAMQSRFR